MDNKFPGPNNRQQLLDSLRPPIGYKLEYAIGTSFSLDLFTLLTVPLAFTFFDFEDSNGKPITDPIVLLEALRRYADKIKIFCQAGHTNEAKDIPLMHVHLENSVIMVKAPNKTGVFHPKIWLLRFENNKKEVFYRFMCLSRNLTFDKSWDTILIMEGELQDRHKAYAANHPLGDFIKILPNLALNKLSQIDKQKIRQVQKEIRKTKFELPEGFSDYQFFHFGIDDYEGFPEYKKIDKIAVISPFVDSGFIKELTQQIDSPTVIISRSECLQELQKSDLSIFKKVYNLSEYADPEREDGNNDQTQNETEKPIQLDGLHAKTYIIESGWDAFILTGSANATTAAFHHNVEFMTELTARKSEFGIDKLLGEEKGMTTFRDLLEEFRFIDQDNNKNADEEKLNYEADNLWRLVVDSDLKINVTKSSNDNLYKYSIIQNKPLKFGNNIKITCRPITLNENYSINLVSRVSADFELSIETISSFIVFEAIINKYGLQKIRRFVLNLPLIGAPDNRFAAILKHTLKDKAHVMRLLLLILDVTDPETGINSQSLRKLVKNDDAKNSYVLEQALFETLIKTLSNNPEMIEHFQKTIEQLNTTPEGTALIPDGLDEILKPIMDARKESIK